MNAKGCIFPLSKISGVEYKRPAMKSTLLRALAGFLIVTATLPLAQAAPITVDDNITLAQVEAAQKAWGRALVQISKDYEKGGRELATRTAKKVIDSAYAYQSGPVLFKPTLTVSPQTFRITREGALAYFVGGNSNFPNDDGFALKGWRSCSIENEAVYISGDLAITMGKVRLKDKNGKITEVDKTWAFKKQDNDTLQIVLHHSSLPHAP